MRNAILILFVASILISCQNDESSSKIDWEQQIGTMVSEYDKNAQLDYSKTIAEDEHNTAELSIYKKNSKNIYKIVGESNFGDVFPIKMVYYIKNNKVIATKFSGLSPYIHKGQKREGDKCCAMIENIKYFKSNVKIVYFKKKLDLMSTEEFDSRNEEFISLDFVKSELENPEVEYERVMDRFEELKEELKL